MVVLIILEIGVPFSDPIADGSAIQNAMTDALRDGVTLQGIFKTISQIKQKRDVPIVLFTYFNPILAMGLDHALHEASKAGIDGILVVDMPLEESSDYFNKCSFYGLEPIGLIAQSTNNDRISRISSQCNAFLYYVCRNGTTGVKTDLPSDYIQKITNIKSQTQKPVVCGFGIGNNKLAQQILKYSDGLVVGSAFVKCDFSRCKPYRFETISS